MARPRKDAEGPGARERIMNAFWDLLAQMPRSAITVGTVVEAARCNRGTFYYYFSDLDELAETAAREEFFADDSLVRAIFGTLVEGDAGPLQRRVPRRRLQRMSVAVRAGERHLVERTVHDEVVKRWESCLCEEGEHLDSSARFAIQFMVGGMLGFIAEVSERGASAGGSAPCPLPQGSHAYLASVSRATLEAVARAQHMTPVEVLARVFHD